MGWSPIREILEPALKNSQADDRQGVDRQEKRELQFHPTSPLTGRSDWRD
jgi:hypothetical protein